MEGDMEALARALLSSQGKAQAAQLEKLAEILKTPDGQRLLSMIASGGGGSDPVRQAAQAALRGDENAAKAAIMKLMATKEGAALIRALAQSMGGGKR